jgi:integrase
MRTNRESQTAISPTRTLRRSRDLSAFLGTQASEIQVTALKDQKKPATLRRYVATIGRAHIGAGLLNTCSGEAIRLALKKMGRDTSARRAQARALGWNEIKQFIGSAGRGLRADRERALLCVAYETLARRSELVALEVRDIEFWPNGTGQALIRRQDRLARAREGGLSLARDGEVAEDLARACEDRGGGESFDG